MEVAPGGAANLIVRTLRNLALDDALDATSAPPPARPRYLEITFPTTAYRLLNGHRLRLAVSSANWPLPTATEPVLVSGTLSLPIADALPADLREPLPPVRGPPVETSRDPVVLAGLKRWSETLPDGTLTYGWAQPFNAVHYRDSNTTFGYKTRAEFTIAPEDPLSACAEYAHGASFARPDGTAEINSIVTATSEADAFYVDASVQVRWNGKVIAARTWSLKLRRRHS